MKISNKLFLGFLVVILINLTFVIVLSRLTKLNSVASMMKKQNEIKEHLLLASEFHKSQARSFLIVNKIKNSESFQKFFSEGKNSKLEIDSILSTMETLIGLDLSLDIGKVQREKDIRLSDILHSGIADKNQIYQDIFKQYHLLYLDTSIAVLQKGVLFDSLYSNANDIDSLLAINFEKAAVLNSQNSALRLEDIETQIENIKSFARITLIAIILFSSIFALFFSSHINRRIKQLKEWTTNISRGEFNLKKEMQFAPDELGELADSFYKMAADLKSTQEELNRASRLAAIGEIVASVNHEINNPLMIISGNAQFLELTIDQGVTDDIKERIRSIIKESDRISTVTQKLRDIKNPVSEDYTTTGEQMINLDKSQ